jgi:hypothetical protein
MVGGIDYKKWGDLEICGGCMVEFSQNLALVKLF